MKNLILHIGHSKCGSTSLQKFFGLNFQKKYISRNGESFIYAEIGPNGKILSKLSLDINGYMPMGSELKFDHPELKKILGSLEEKFEETDNLILSSEGWSNHNIITPYVKKAFESQSYKVKIFMVTRPQIEFLNSGWWQWGVWEYKLVENWVKSHTDNVNFFSRLSQWSIISNVEQINVCDISQDIFKSFLKSYSIEVEEISMPESSNIGTNIDLLRHIYNRKDFYGRTVHDPRIEFKLNEVLNLKRVDMPFVIDFDLSKKVLIKNQASNKSLIEMMKWPDKNLEQENIEKYLNVNYYESHNVEDIKDILKEDEGSKIFNDKVIDLYEKFFQ